MELIREHFRAIILTLCYEKLVEYNRCREGPPKTTVVPENIDAVRELIMQDRHVIYREIELSLGISPTNIHWVLHEHLAVKTVVLAESRNRSKQLLTIGA